MIDPSELAPLSGNPSAGAVGVGCEDTTSCEVEVSPVEGSHLGDAGFDSVDGVSERPPAIGLRLFPITPKSY